MSFFKRLAYMFGKHKHVKVQASSSALLVTLPIAAKRTQTAKITAKVIEGTDPQLIAVSVVSRAGFPEDHKLVRKALEYNAGKQRVALCLSDDCDPPALDAILCVPIDPHDEHAPIEIWDVMVEVAAVADNLERQLSSTDEL